VTPAFLRHHGRHVPGAPTNGATLCRRLLTHTVPPRLSVTAIAAVPAAALCGPFPALAAVSASPDHELLVLGAQLERVLQERYIHIAKENDRRLREKRAAQDREIAELEAAGYEVTEDQALAIRRVVIARLDSHKPRERLTDEEYDDWPNEMWEVMNELDDKIMAIQPKTAAGLAIQVISWREQETWYDEGSGFVPFLESAFLGVRSVHSVCQAMQPENLRDLLRGRELPQHEFSMERKMLKSSIGATLIGAILAAPVVHAASAEVPAQYRGAMVQRPRHERYAILPLSKRHRRSLSQHPAQSHQPHRGKRLLRQCCRVDPQRSPTTCLLPERR
jgi:hypothetical protein